MRANPALAPRAYNRAMSSGLALWLGILVVLPFPVHAQSMARYYGDGQNQSGISVTVPISTLPLNLVSYGDSIAAGTSNGNPWGTGTATLLGAPWAGYNKGVSGETAAQIKARYLSGRLTDCLGEACGYVVVEGGVNSLKGGAITTPEAAIAGRALLAPPEEQPEEDE